MDVVASGSSAELQVTPPEILIDVPFGMGCYKIRDDDEKDEANAYPIAKEVDMSDPSPASCILECLQKGADYRISGKMLEIKISRI